MSDESTADNLLAALTALQNTNDEIEHRVYYEEITRECTIKTTEKPIGYYVVVSREEYDAVDFCPNYFVTANGAIEKKKFDFTPKPLLVKKDNGEFRSVKDHIVFRVDEGYLGDSDRWGLRGYDNDY